MLIDWSLFASYIFIAQFHFVATYHTYQDISNICVFETCWTSFWVIAVLSHAGNLIRFLLSVVTDVGRSVPSFRSFVTLAVYFRQMLYQERCIERRPWLDDLSQVLNLVVTLAICLARCWIMCLLEFVTIAVCVLFSWSVSCFSSSMVRYLLMCLIFSCFFAIL